MNISLINDELRVILLNAWSEQSSTNCEEDVDNSNL